jgi:hypothetical protein
LANLNFKNQWWRSNSSRVKKNSKFVQRKQNPKKLNHKRAPNVQEAMREIENKIWGIILCSQFKQVRV